MDPAGIGARDLQECLVIQIWRKPHTIATRTAKEILEFHYNEFVKKHYDKIIHKLEIEEEDLRDAIEEITHLNPKPGNSMNETSRPIEQVIPDFTLVNEGDEIQVLLNGRNAPELRISRKYSEMLDDFAKIKGQPNKAQREAMMFVKQKLDSAKWFVDAILQRQHTLITTMKTIVEYQKELE